MSPSCPAFPLPWTHCRACMAWSAVLGILTVLCLAPSAPALAWWNGEWAYRKQITIDATAAGVPAAGSPVAQVVVPVRLTLADFKFADAHADGADLRFVAADDATPLPYHLEKFSRADEVAVAWVQAPAIGSRPETLWLYHGNPKASAAGESAATYDAATALVLHFGDGEALPRDSSAYRNHAVRSTARAGAPGVIHAAVAFEPDSSLVIAASPSIAWAPQAGLTATLWLRIDAPQQAVVFRQGGLELLLDGSRLFARWAGADGKVRAVPEGAALEAGTWHHVALVSTPARTALYVDGAMRAEIAEGPADVGGDIVFGASASRPGFRGLVDEVRFDGVARSPEWIALAAKQYADSRLTSVAEDEAGTAGEYGEVLRTLVRSVSRDGWVIIGCIAVLGLLAGSGIVGKYAELGRGAAADRNFLARFRTGGNVRAALPDAGGTDMPAGFAGSPLYDVYRDGIAALDRLPRPAAGQPARLLKPHELQLLRSAVDQAMVQQVNRMNRGMVRLTMAISGAPFFGLLGTVFGIMITFGTIALVGDVNVNTIAPGVAAALSTTVAGLVVALPVMFAYNHLASRIREASVGVQVFGDELVARLAADYEDEG